MLARRVERPAAELRKLFASGKAGERFAWCACGLSKQQPVCDGSHKVTDLRPVVKVAEKDETIWLCGCKMSGTKPYCDGTHNSL